MELIIKHLQVVWTWTVYDRINRLPSMYTGCIYYSDFY